MKVLTPRKLALAVSAQVALTAGVAPLAIAQDDGTYRRLTPEEIVQRRDELQAQMDEYCGN